MLELCAALTVFVGGHILISGTRLRQRAAAAIGENVYLALFTLFAGASMLWVALSYRAAPWLDIWLPPSVLRWPSLVLIGIALWLLVDGVAARLRTRPALPPPAGAHAVTRQPIMVSIILWAGAHLLVRGDAATMLLFCSFAVLGIAGARSQDRKARARHGDTGLAEAAAASLVPFLGAARLRLGELSWQTILVALILLLAMLWLHPLVFGLSPLP